MEAWEEVLSDHPNAEFRDYILDGIINGVNIGHSGQHSNIICKNWPSVNKYHNAVEDIIRQDVARGRKVGPFHTPPEHFVGSPLGAFEKKHTPGKYRVIHDLSWPPGQSVNEQITEDCSVHYVTIDDIVNQVKSFGVKGVKMSKLDLENAYKHIFVRVEDRHLLGNTWDTTNSDELPIREYYLDITLPFGLKSSAKHFTLYADGLQYAMTKNGVSKVSHYLDDYFTCGHPNSMECEANLAIMSYTCNLLGFGIQPSKIVYATTELEYIGITIDSVAMELRISDSRLREINQDLLQWIEKMSCTKRELLSLIGKLNFICRVVKSGRTFLRRLIDESKRAKYLHYRISLSPAARKDIEWWLAYLPSWNGISVFCDDVWSTNVDLHLWTDASDLAIGAYFGQEWFCEPFTGLTESYKCMSITWRELYAIVKAVATWCHHLKGKMILFHCDNEAVCHIIQSGTSKDPAIMSLIRALFFMSAGHDFVCSAVHVRGSINTAADALSRCMVHRFKELVPGANELPSKLGHVMINL